MAKIHRDEVSLFVLYERTKARPTSDGWTSPLAPTGTVFREGALVELHPDRRDTRRIIVRGEHTAERWFLEKAVKPKKTPGKKKRVGKKKRGHRKKSQGNKDGQTGKTGKGSSKARPKTRKNHRRRRPRGPNRRRSR